MIADDREVELQPEPPKVSAAAEAVMAEPKVRLALSMKPARVVAGLGLLVDALVPAISQAAI